ncbi:coil containing protein [Vibrio phage 1.137.O._10N.261.46.B5]|nr:hypothetical protein NVP1119O_09 [Vibrio phage 1.119.O._10N.261.51.A9]AUR89599.1 hypothetical protein NVP1127O_07 [Vibrio phage 1.127.O._10N.286.52.E12]AUR90061.1 coil containing protein [Vibrio phage 1.137.O._10N.261.46.B5]AUR90381.1 hypothetical protein NVP1143O_09 [Vibrio phage 1.143.O._10N.261.55.C8]AUR96667.1 hypothetical protein NVP1231O_09 [Vibrio phage 1.231.O._10N.261.49.F8]
MKDMKMSDVFTLPVYYEHDPLSEVAKFSGWQGHERVCKSAFLAFDDCDADAICEAINNYDRLQQENAELLKMLKYAVKVANDKNATYTAIEVLNMEAQSLLDRIKND